MIKKTVFCCLILLAINFYLRDIYRPNVVVSQSQWQDNQISAQNFLYSDTDNIENVIIGSSMSLRLIMDSLPEFCNLSFGGETAREGLNILLYKKAYPKRVFVEINTLVKVSDKNFETSLYNPILLPVREKLLFMRDGRQPLPLFALKFRENVVERAIPAKFVYGGVLADSDSVIKGDEVSKRSVVKLSDEQKRLFETVKVNIDSLMKLNVEVIFFEMPNEQLDCQEQPISPYRELVENAYSSKQYLYLPTPPCGAYKTTDGVHLGYDEARRYTSFFKSAVDSLIRCGR